jgi:hypothetical protein
MKRLLSLTTFIVVATLFSCGGGGGGSLETPDTSNLSSPPQTPDTQEETIVVRTLNGTIAENKATPSDVAFISAIYWDKQVNGTVNVPVRENTVKVNNGTFSLPVEDGKYALFLFDKNYQPIGFVGESDKPYVFNITENKEVTVYLDDKDNDNVTEADIEGINPDLADDSFSGDSDNDGIPDAVDPDFLSQFFKVKLLPVYKMENELTDDNGNFEKEVYYYYDFSKEATPNRVGSSFEALWEDDDGNRYLKATDEEGSETGEKTDIPFFKFHFRWIQAPVFLNPYDPEKGRLSFEEIAKFKKNILEAIREWNEGMIEGYGEGAGLVYLGVVPEEKISISTVLPDLNANYTYAPISYGVYYEKYDFTDRGRTSIIAKLDWEMRNPMILNVTLDNGTQRTMKYENRIKSNAYVIGIKDITDSTAIAHELGHYIGLEHPFEYNYGDTASVMNYYQYNMTEAVSDFDKELIKTVWGYFKDYGVDLEQVRDAYVEYVGNHTVQVFE